MSATREIYKWQKAIASAKSTELLLDTLRDGDVQLASAMYREDLDECQALRMVMAAVEEVLIERFPALNDALDMWCEEMPDERTMAQFVVDYVTAVSK